MRIDPTLPHHPYIAAVAEALADCPHAPALTGVRGLFGDGNASLLTAVLTRHLHAVLIWQPDLGWRRASNQNQFEAPETAPRLTTALVPAPADVAKAWRAWEDQGPEFRDPFACEETTPDTRELPGRLATALENGEVTEDMAQRLAAYISVLYPYEDLWGRRVTAHLANGRTISGRLCPPGPMDPVGTDGSGGHRIEVATGASTWRPASQILQITPRTR